MDDKEKKISQLRNLLSLAKNKIQQLKNNLQAKDKQLTQVKLSFEKKIKTLQDDSGQIMKQYEERLLRIQKQLEQSNTLVQKYQKQANTQSKSQQKTGVALTHIGNITTRIFTLSKIKDSAQAVQQLCNIQKCKEFMDEIEKIQDNDDITPIIKSSLKIIQLLSQALVKKREARLSFMKKETQLKKRLQQQSQKTNKIQQKLIDMKDNVKKTQIQWQQKIDQVAKSKAKISQQKTNLQFIKQLVIKLFTGQKQASLMALQVLSKVLKMDKQEHILCSKKIK